jgi:hypothetical protein
MTLGVCPHPLRWLLLERTADRAAEPPCCTSLAYIIGTAVSALILLAGLLPERSADPLSYALQNRAVTHR